VTDSPNDKETSVESPAGFKSTRLKAKLYLADKDKAAELLKRAQLKAGQKRGALAGVWDDLMSLFRLLKCWINGEYPGAGWQTMLLVITGVLYFVMPFDVIPDFLVFLGFFDDAAIIAYIVSIIRGELETFVEWEAQVQKQNPGELLEHQDADKSDN
jgi:uncharacterized membrane protein YkvA (DUF1232 family)